jgi:hypothetical protein
VTSLKRRVEKLERRPPPPGRHSAQFNDDALWLYEMAFELNGEVHPNWRSIEESSIGIRGKELRFQKYGPIVPLHQCPDWSRRTHANGEFQSCFDREPIEGDLLRCEHVRTMRGPELNEINLASRSRLGSDNCHTRCVHSNFEDGVLFKRRRSGEWFEAVGVSWKAHWWGVECDAENRSRDWAYGINPELWSESDPAPLARLPSVLAVTFLGVIDGKHACRPATEDELRQPEQDEFFRELWSREPTIVPPSGRVWVRDRRTGFYATLPIEQLTVATEGLDAAYEKCSWRTGENFE